MSRIVVLERRLVAELLAGGPVEVLAGELVDDQLRAVARAVAALRAWRRPPIAQDVIAAVRAQGGDLQGEEYELLMREGGMRRAA
jgi:hypothetical protein